MLNDLKLAFRRLSKSELLRCCMIEKHHSQVLGPSYSLIGGGKWRILSRQ